MRGIQATCVPTRSNGQQMPVIHLENSEDARLGPFRHLKTTNESRGRTHFIVEGEKLLLRLLDSKHAVESVLASEDYVTRLPLSQLENVPIFVLPHERLEELVGFHFHRGVLARGRRQREPELGTFLVTHPGTLLLVICPDVQDPENLGAVIRNSSAFGVDAIILGPRCADPFSRRVLRVSMGTALRMSILESDDLAEDLERLREARVELAATVLDPGAESLERASRSERFALLFGSEGHGLEPIWIDRCSRRITIPMHGGTDSLNVAVATGVFLYHFTRAPTDGLAG